MPFWSTRATPWSTGTDPSRATQCFIQARDSTATSTDVPGFGQAHTVAAAEPGHGHRGALGPQRLVVGDPFVEGEQVVDRALEDEGGDPNPRQGGSRARCGEECCRTPVDDSGRVHLMVGGQDLGVEAGRDATPTRIPPQPAFGVALLSRLVTRECHAMVGAMASTRQSSEAVTSWMPPP